MRTKNPNPALMKVPMANSTTTATTCDLSTKCELGRGSDLLDAAEASADLYLTRFTTLSTRKLMNEPKNSALCRQTRPYSAEPNLFLGLFFPLISLLKLSSCMSVTRKSFSKITDEEISNFSSPHHAHLKSYSPFGSGAGCGRAPPPPLRLRYLLLGFDRGLEWINPYLILALLKLY